MQEDRAVCILIANPVSARGVVNDIKRIRLKSRQQTRHGLSQIGIDGQRITAPIERGIRSE